MPYTIDPAEDGEYVITTVVGDMTREFANQLAIEANAVGAPLGIRCYLWDLTESRNVESALDNYKSAHVDLRSIPEVDRRACVAVLVAEDDHSHDTYEAYAQTAGLDVVLFRDRGEAIAHLKLRAEYIKSLPTESDET